MRPHPIYWLARHYKSRHDFAEAMKCLYVVDAINWPETAPRTDYPTDFAQLLHARGR